MNPRRYEATLGRVPSCVSVDDQVIRYVNDEDDDLAGYVAQGHVTNTTKYPLDDVKIDISFADVSGNFLGLNKTGLADVDQIPPKGTIPFEIDLEIPHGAVTCTLNVAAKEVRGLWDKLWW